MSLTFCLGFRRWYPRHLQRCLASLRAHTDAPVVVADLGDDPDLVSDLCSPYKVYVPHMSRAEWSRAAALNLAAKVAAGLSSPPDWLCFTDADMLFPRSWFGIGHLTEGIWLTRSRDLNEHATGLLNLNMPEKREDDWAAWDHWLFQSSTPHGNDLGQGAAMLVPRAWFERVGGFDEYYQVWGCEDNDLTARAEWDGLAVQWLPTGAAYEAGKWGVEAAWVAHQWHRRDWPTPEQYAQVKRNRQYFYQRVHDRGPIVRNRS